MADVSDVRHCATIGRGSRPGPVLLGVGSGRSRSTRSTWCCCSPSRWLQLRNTAPDCPERDRRGQNGLHTGVRLVGDSFKAHCLLPCSMPRQRGEGDILAHPMCSQLPKVVSRTLVGWAVRPDNGVSELVPFVRGPTDVPRPSALQQFISWLQQLPHDGPRR